MNTTREVRRIELRKRELAEIVGCRGQVICCEAGEIWLTVAGQAVDVILLAGKSWPVTSRGTVVVSGLTPSRFVLRPGADAPAVSRAGGGLRLELPGVS